MTGYKSIFHARKLIAHLCEVLEKKRSTEKVHRSSYFTVIAVFLNAQPYPKVKNAAQDFCDGWAVTTLLLQ